MEAQQSAEWGGEAIDPDVASAFAQRVQCDVADRERVRRTLLDFPVECRVRGMFFQGLVDTIGRGRAADRLKQLLDEAGVHSRFVPFTLMPHRDFYKLYFLAAAALYPAKPLEHGFERIAEDFYPTFRSSMVGRTLSAFIGAENITILERLAQAYQLSVPWNEHSVRKEGDSRAVWTCKVEPSDLYPATFRGIVRGAMGSHGVTSATTDVLMARRDGPAMRFEFAIRW